jgi:hypothetical protein
MFHVLKVHAHAVASMEITHGVLAPSVASNLDCIREFCPTHRDSAAWLVR